MFFRILITTFLLLLAHNHNLNGQVSDYYHWGHYQIFQENYRIDTSRQNQILFRINNSNFFKNNEYQNDYVIGQTLVGLFFEPSIDFYAGPKTRIRTGAHFLKYHGTEKFQKIKPIVTIQHQASDYLDILFGTIYSTTNHGLLEPLMGFENYLSNHYENGMQFLFSYPNFKADFWLDWEQFIQQDDPFQEHFTVGGHMLFPIVDGPTWKLNADVQMIFRHKGGQIDSSDLPASTQSNFAQGMEFTRKFESSFFKEFMLGHYYLGAYEINPGNHLSITEGLSLYTLAGLETKIGQFRVGYWRGKDYFAPHAEALFLSASQYNPDFYNTDRRMITIKYQIHKKLANFLDLAFRFEPYYHLDTGRLDHSWSVYLMIDKAFFITQFNK